MLRKSVGMRLAVIIAITLLGVGVGSVLLQWRSSSAPQSLRQTSLSASGTPVLPHAAETAQHHFASPETSGAQCRPGLSRDSALLPELLALEQKSYAAQKRFEQEEAQQREHLRRMRQRNAGKPDRKPSPASSVSAPISWPAEVL